MRGTCSIEQKRREERRGEQKIGEEKRNATNFEGKKRAFVRTRSS
jgi:hypothetical protein